MMYRMTGERYITSTLTNLGNIKLPAEMAKQVQRMDVVLLRPENAHRRRGHQLQRPHLFEFSKPSGKPGWSARLHHLIKLGVPVKIESNE